jgi:hypothetical protein
VYNRDGRAEDRSLAELLEAARGDGADDGASVSQQDATDALARAGLRWPPAKHVESGKLAADTVLVNTRSDRIGRWFENTPWAAGWLSTLARAPGAEQPAWAQVKFAGTNCRVLAIPKAVFFDDEDGPVSP